MAGSRSAVASYADKRRQGRDEYRFTVRAIKASGYLSALKLVIGGMCLFTMGLGLLTIIHPLGPGDPTARAIQLIISMSALPVGIWWMVAPWPSYWLAIGFVAWGDVSLAIGAMLYTTPQTQISTAVDMAVIGVFAAFLLGIWVLAAHCAAAAILLTTLTVRSAILDDYTWFDLYPFLAPAVLTVVVLPFVIQATIEGGRRGIRGTARQANRDPMSGLLNRRGMYSEAKKLLDSQPTRIAAALIDLDRFKEINDRLGHEEGDEVLKTVAAVLRSSVRHGDIVARVGGDEFVVIAAMQQITDIDGFAERLRTALAAVADTVSASVGIASGDVGGDWKDVVDSVLRQADRAMYDAKRRARGTS